MSGPWAMYSRAVLVLAIMALLLAGVECQKGVYNSNRHLWYSTPGTNFNSGMAIGNGRIGAVIYGSANETVVLNEASVWSGQWTDRINPNANASFPVARQALVDGKYGAAETTVLRNMAAIPPKSQSFSITNNLGLNFGHSPNTWKNYERWLDTLDGHTGVSYDYNGVTYTREYVADFASGVVAVRLTSSREKALNVTVSLERGTGILGKWASTDNNTITIDVGDALATAIPFTAGVRVATSDGTVKTGSDSTLVVSGATTVDLFYDAETSFQWKTQNLWKAELKRKLTQAASQGFLTIANQAKSNHKNLAGRVQLDLGSGSQSALATDKRISAYRSTPDADHSFITLMFNFGRHLLISASRDTGRSGLGVPANLQEMNYWMAESTNLPDTLRPLWDLMYRSRDKGGDVAKRMYNCPGYVSHHNLDIWGDSAPHDSGAPWTMWPVSNLWLTHHMMEHYRYGGDVTFLRNKAWPLFKDALAFYDCYLFKLEGYWATGPSISPENSFFVPSGQTDGGSKRSIDISPTMDMSLLHEFFTNVIEAADALNIPLNSDPILAKVESYRAGLRPHQIGSKGQILEWRKEYTEQEPGHRHISHLWDLFPGSQMTPLVNNTLAVAARKSLDLRLANNGGATGWSRTWVSACQARLHDGNATYNSVVNLLSNQPMTNLFHAISRGGVFQIDSNLGFPAVVTEFLLQSHAGVVHLLPALPPQLPQGSISGIVARGGFIVSISWQGGDLTEASIKSVRGGALKVRVADGQSFKINGRAVESVDTVAGSTYKITL
ncbi:hypothetical protein IL306_009609 [Fusarium sp. DS 682]|nr:hypothetical protein IL306_009609 [Fusarium sp. DS 682]